MVRNGVVVAPEHFAVIRIGTQQGNTGRWIQRKHATPVLKEDQRLFGHLAGQFHVGLPFQFFVFQMGPGLHVAVQFSQADTGRQQPLQGTVYIGLIQKTFLYGLRNLGIGVAALQIRTRVNGGSHCRSSVRAEAVTAGLIEITHGPAVRYHESLIAPFSAKDGIDQVIAGPARLPAEAVVGYHHFLHIGLGYQVLEGRQVGFSQIPLGDLRIVGMAVPLRTGMHGKVLGAGVSLEDIGLGRALQASDHGHSQLTGEERIFSVGFHSAAPARVPEDIDIGRPEGKPLIPAHVAGCESLTVLDAGFVAYCGKHLIHQRLVKGSRHGDGHREHGSLSVTGHAVKGFVPPVVGRDAQGLDGGR